MTPKILTGLSGTNPLGFLAALGLTRILTAKDAEARLGFETSGVFSPYLQTQVEDLAGLVARDAATCKSPAWWLEYAKEEKQGTKQVADLKAPPEEFAKFLEKCQKLWLKGQDEAVAYAAAFGTSVAWDGKGNTKPSAFHFTAANQQFLDTIETQRLALDRDWVQASLFQGQARRPGSNLRWDPAAERNWALMAENPNQEGTSVDAPLEWLAFRALPLFPTFPVNSSRGPRVATTAVSEMCFTWGLWAQAASLMTLRSLLQLKLGDNLSELRERGLFLVCSSAIRRTAQGFGNFGPSSVTPT